MEYKPEYMADYYAGLDTHHYIVVQEIKTMREYSVEATSLQDAITQIEEGNYNNVSVEDDCGAEEIKGRVVAARIDKEMDE